MKSKKIETKEELEKRWRKCESLIEQARGRIITQSQAKEINKLQKGGFDLTELRLNEKMTLVVMKRVYDNEYENASDNSIREQLIDPKNTVVFLIEGQIGKKLNMS